MVKTTDQRADHGTAELEAHTSLVGERPLQGDDHHQAWRVVSATTFVGRAELVETRIECPGAELCPLSGML